MRLRQTKLSPLLRSFAALALLVYVFAQGLCVAHCSGIGRGDSTPSCCHRDTTKSACHGQEDSSFPFPVSSASATCVTLKNQVTSGGALTIVVPNFFALYVLSPFALAFDATVVEPGASFPHQANHRDRILTPEVSLGPAFRSLAPPFVG